MLKIFQPVCVTLSYFVLSACSTGADNLNQSAALEAKNEPQTQFSLTVANVATNKTEQPEYCFLELKEILKNGNNSKNKSKIVDVLAVSDQSLSEDALKKLKKNELILAVTSKEPLQRKLTLLELKADINNAQRESSSNAWDCKSAAVALKGGLGLISDEQMLQFAWGPLIRFGFWGLGAGASFMMGGDFGDYPKAIRGPSIFGQPAIHRPYW